MKTEKEIYNLIKWNPKFTKTDFYIGFSSRDNFIKKVPFDQFSPNGDIPWHRIKFFYYFDSIIWDRINKYENLKVFDSKHEILNTSSNYIENKLKKNLLKCCYYDQNSLSWNILSKSISINANTFSLMSINVLCDTYEKEIVNAKVRYPKLIKFIENKADIICMQEVTPYFFELILSENWVQSNYFISYNINDLWKPFGVLILSKFPLSNIEYLFINPDKRPALMCTLNFSSIDLKLINLHLSSNRRGCVEKRNEEILNIITSNCSNKHIIITGDFNFNDDSESYDLLNFGYIDIDRFFYNNNTTYTYNPEINKLACKLSPFGTPRRMDRFFIKSQNSIIIPSYFDVIQNIEFIENDHISFLTDHFPIYSEFEIFNSCDKDTLNINCSLYIKLSNFDDILLLTSDKSIFFDNNLIRYLNSIRKFECYPIKEANSLFISTIPENGLNLIQNIINSASTSTVLLNKDFRTIKNSIDTPNALLSSIYDQNGNTINIDIYYFDYKSEKRFDLKILNNIDIDKQSFIKYLSNKYNLSLIGSYLLVSNTKYSDIDFYSIDSIEILSQKLSLEFNIRIVGNRTKSIKFEYLDTLIDIQFDKSALELNMTLYNTFKNNIELYNILKIIRYWASRRRIDTQAYGYLSGTAWSLLVCNIKPRNLYDFFNKFDTSILPKSFTEAFSNYSNIVINFEIKRAKGLIHSDVLFDKRDLRILSNYELKNTKIDLNLFKSIYLKFTRQIEENNGFVDIVENKLYYFNINTNLFLQILKKYIN